MAFFSNPQDLTRFGHPDMNIGLWGMVHRRGIPYEMIQS